MEVAVFYEDQAKELPCGGRMLKLRNTNLNIGGQDVCTVFARCGSTYKFVLVYPQHQMGRRVFSVSDQESTAWVFASSSQAYWIIDALRDGRITLHSLNGIGGKEGGCTQLYLPPKKVAVLEE